MASAVASVVASAVDEVAAVVRDVSSAARLAIFRETALRPRPEEVPVRVVLLIILDSKTCNI